VPIAVILILAIAWIVSGRPSQIQFNLHTMIPDFGNPQNWVSLTAIMTAFIGIELAAVHAKDIENPQRTFPLALFVSLILILATMIAGSLAIAIVLPENKISLVSGVLQAFNNFLSVWHLSWLEPVMTLMIIVGSAGGIISWVISPARGLLQAGQMGYLPEFLSRTNRHGVAANLLICQAVLVSIFCMVFLLLPSVNGSYWFLTALSTQMYMIMYFVLFIAGIVSHYRIPKNDTGFRIPGGAPGMWIACLLGMAGCLMTEFIGFLPPHRINIGSVFRYEMMFVMGMIAILLPAVAICCWQSRRKHKQQ
jgi:glutamate:GABA antiporter